MPIFFRSGWRISAIACLMVGTAALRANTFIVANNLDSGAGSLRQALLNVNASPGSNTIQFQLTGAPPFTITPASALPAATNLVVIDGDSQPGFAGTPIIELNGASAGSNAVGLELDADSCTVRGLVINRFAAQGLVVSGASNVIQGNFIGTDPSGAVARGNGGYGVWVLGQANLVGGTEAGEGNVISGGKDAGIFIYRAGGNTVEGNLIGVTAAGTNALPNAQNGIVIFGSSGNQIGGVSAAARNVISGNGASGVFLTGTGASNNLVRENFIGTDVSGSAVIGNAADGITLLNAPFNVLGGAGPAAANVISGNGLAGISLNNAGTFSNLVWGNFIGTDAAGKLAFGNHAAGVTVSGAVKNQIGGSGAGAGNLLSGNVQDGIFLTGGAAANVVQGNFIGLTAAGTNALPNGFNGISVSGASSNVIGGPVAGARNVISGNTDNGVGILSPGDTANCVQGNFIGADAAGHRAVANGLAGVRIEGCTNVVGGTAPGAGNVISGNGQQGIWLVGTNGNVTGNQIQGNLIGLDAAGAAALGNGNAGIGISSAAGNLIGGTVPGARNVISANGDAGVFLIGAGTAGNSLQGNYLGTDVTGTVGRGNTYEGIYAQGVTGNVIGGSVPGAGNLISGNHTRGLWLTGASGNVIQGNFIGTTADGTNALGNVFHGIDIDAGSSNNLVGGTVPGAGNRLAWAQTIYAGVRVRDGAANNQISGNAIFNNGALGIDLGNFGVNSNYDCESGVPGGAANRGQNFPVLADACRGTATRIRGTLEGAAGNTYRLEFFGSPAGDTSGYGEGQDFLGQTTVTLGSGCSSNFTVYLPPLAASDQVVTATATDAAGNSSEFSAWVPVVSVPPLQVNSAGAGGSQIALAWTNNGGSFELQQTFNLRPPAAWVTVDAPAVLTNGTFVVSLPVTPTNTFYRLLAP